MVAALHAIRVDRNKHGYARTSGVRETHCHRVFRQENRKKGVECAFFRERKRRGIKRDKERRRC